MRLAYCNKRDILDEGARCDARFAFARARTAAVKGCDKAAKARVPGCRSDPRDRVSSNIAFDSTESVTPSPRYKNRRNDALRIATIITTIVTYDFAVKKKRKIYTRSPREREREIE